LPSCPDSVKLTPSWDAGGFDLPIALGVLVATRQLKPKQLGEFATVSELALDGSVRPVRYAMSMTVTVPDLGPRG
jgi:magnesium chelatase family protein